MAAEASFRKAALPLLPALAANAAAQSFLLVVLPLLGRDLGFSPVQTGLLLGIAALLMLVAAPLWGNASERWGRRPVLLSGLAGAAIGTALMGFVIGLRLNGMLASVPTLALLFAVRAGQSLLSAGLLPAAQAWMADRSPPERRAEGMGLLGAAYGMGGILGAGVAFAIGGKYPVGALLGLSLAVLLGLAIVWLKLTDRPDVAYQAAPAYRLKVTMGRIWPGLLVTFLGVSVYGIMQHVTALRLEDGFGLARADAISRAGGALMGSAIVMALAQTLGLRWLKLPPLRLMLFGAAAGLVAMTGVLLATDATVLTAALLAMGMALGLLLPGNLAFLSLRAETAGQGRVAGINAVAQGLGMAAGPIAGAVLHRLSFSAPAAVAMATMGIVIAAALAACKGEPT